MLCCKFYFFFICFSEIHPFFKFFPPTPPPPPQTSLGSMPMGSFHYIVCHLSNTAQAILHFHSLLALFFSCNKSTCQACSSACGLLQATAVLLSIALLHFCNDICRQCTLSLLFL